MRIRITFSKTNAMRYTGHLDLHRAWERTFRRAQLPLAYSQGFHPQPRLNLASALPLGITSDCELLDAWLEIPQPIDYVLAALVKAAPPGIKIFHIDEIINRLPALQTQVISAEYRIKLLDPVPDLDDRLDRLILRNSIIRQRRGKDYNLRPLIENVSLLPPDDVGCQCFHLRLSAREAATGRPEEVLAELNIPIEAAYIKRTAMILRRDS